MYKIFLFIKIFLLFFTISYAQDLKIVYVNVEKIMQESIAGKSIKNKLEQRFGKI